MRSISSETIIFIILIVRKHSGKGDLWVKIAWKADRSASTRGTSLSQRDSKLSHEIEASDQSVQDGAQILGDRTASRKKIKLILKVVLLMMSNTAPINHFPVCLFKLV